MKKAYIKPEFHCIAVQISPILACSICEDNGNHYGHHKHNDFEEEENNV